jgi:arylsulfatase A-like enzyme
MARRAAGTSVLACGALLAGVLVAGSCASARYISSPPTTIDLADLPDARTKHVLLVSVDGLRPDAISRFKAPTLQRLAREGSYTLFARTILPSKTLPSHTSMLTGEPPERHGVLWNNVLSADTDRIAQTTVFGVARAKGYSTAAFFSKPKFQPLQQPGALDYSQAPGGWFGAWRSARTVSDVERYLATAKPNLLFVHLADVDRAGHASGWMSDRYGAAVAECDSAIDRLMTAADRAFGKDAYTLIVTADHGGHGQDHGSDDPQDVTIPWIVWGRGVRSGELSAPIRTMDTASTVLWLLGLDEPTDWAGSPVTQAFAAPGVSD